MVVEFMLFDAVGATESDLASCYDVLRTSAAIDSPDMPIRPFDTYVKEVRKSASILGPRQLWVGRLEGRIVATGSVVLPESENLHLTITTVRVDPEHQRRGIGTGLLSATLPGTRAAGRSLVTGQGVTLGGGSEQWVVKLGFRRVQEFALQRLTIPEVDPKLWQVDVPTGFHARSWVGSAPEDLVSQYAHARTAITDAPTAESSLEFPDWTVERVRTYEAEFVARGSEQWVVVAVDDNTGTIAGLTEVDVSPLRPHEAFQLDTAVLPEFRGNGLGRFIKAEMVRWLRTERPQLERIYTNTDAGNVHMIRVNHQIGYVTTKVVADFEAAIDELEERISASMAAP